MYWNITVIKRLVALCVRLIVIWDVLKRKQISYTERKQQGLIVIWDVLKLLPLAFFKDIVSINSNMGCIETQFEDGSIPTVDEINSNMGCIETNHKEWLFEWMYWLIVIWDVLKLLYTAPRFACCTRLIVIWDVLKPQQQCSQMMKEHRLIVIWDVLKPKREARWSNEKERLIVIWDVLKQIIGKFCKYFSMINSNMGCIETSV